MTPERESTLDLYRETLSGSRLKACYDLAPIRVRRYLEAEVDHVLSRIGPDDRVLDLGCGYGRTVLKFARKARLVVGIDTSMASLRFGWPSLRNLGNISLMQMDASRLSFTDGSFSITACIQNGISVFRTDPRLLIRESLRATRAGGRVLFSTYSPKFWEHRLDWFQKQADAGLIGEIDFERTGDDVIVCKDGFRAGILSPEQWTALISDFNVPSTTVEVDGSSLFFEIEKP